MLFTYFVSFALVVETFGARLTTGDMAGKLRLVNPILMMGEELFRVENKNGCFEKLFCTIETELQDDVINPLKHYSRFLTNTHNDFEQTAFEELAVLLRKYPNFSKIADAIKLGQSTNDGLKCQTAFPTCDTDQTSITNFARRIGDDIAANFAASNKYQVRSDPCDASRTACDLIGGGCAICEIFTEGLCGIGCAPGVDVACAGAAGLGCALGSLFG